MQQRVDKLENEFEVVKELLMSAARYAESANQRIDRLGEKQDQTQVMLDQLGQKQDRTQAQLDQLGARVDQVVATQQEIQRVMLQLAERQLRSDAAIETLVDAVTRLTQNSEADRSLMRQQQAQISEMQSEVRGLQTENRRILEFLQNRDSNGEG